MKRLVITGASGFLGGHIAQYAAERFETLGLFATYRFNLKDIASQKIDLTNPPTISAVLDQFKPAIVVHNAALADPDRCENQPELARQINVVATERIATWCRQNSARLIYISTDMVFDGEKGHYSESDQPDPVSVYGRSKADAEERVLAINPETSVGRIALMYGRGIFRRVYSSEWIERELRLRANQSAIAPLGLFADQFRSMLSVRNAAQAILELAESNFRGILHIGGADRISRYDFGEKLCHHLGLPLTAIHRIYQADFKSAAPRPRDVSLNIDLARSILKTPLLSVAAGLNEAYQ
ncbi:MAG: SDR family oxidoreductase [Candidatus Neomarinimicrobiota bacterium]